MIFIQIIINKAKQPTFELNSEGVYTQYFLKNKIQTTPVSQAVQRNFFVTTENSQDLSYKRGTKGSTRQEKKQICLG